ncbi:MAG: ATP synthase subunit I [Gammaproteobacteria bacterium]
MQAGCTLIVAGVSAVFRPRWGLSALIGGGIGTLATAAAVLCVSITRTATPARLLGIQYLAELIKIGLTLALFVLTFVLYKGVAPGALFAAYIATLLAYGIAMLWA